MAQINWKVAIIGIIALVIIAAGGVFVYMHMNKDPEALYAKGEELLAEVLKESESLAQSGNYTEDDIERLKTDYTEAQNQFGGAYGATKDKDFKIEILFKIVDFHKIDNPFHPMDWKKAISCLNQILTLDKTNIQANKALLDYMIEVADSISATGTTPSASIWDSMKQYSTDLLAAYQNNNVTPEIYVRIAKAQSILMLAKAGQTVNINSSVKEAIAELESILESDPSNAKVYDYLGQALLFQASNQSIGRDEAMQTALEKQSEYLQKAIEENPENPEPYITLLNAKLVKIQNDLEAYKALEADYIALTKQFNDDARVYKALAVYYYAMYDKIDLSIENLTKAQQLDPENVRYSVELVNNYLRKGLMNHDIDAFKAGAPLAQKALKHPQTIETEGLRESANRINRFELYSLLAMTSFEGAFASEGSDRTGWTNTLEEAVYQLDQFYGDAKSPMSLKWNGLLEIAKENYDKGTLKLYNAYSQFRATATVTNEGNYVHTELKYLPYVLARLYKGKNEIGLYRQFLSDALSNQIVSLAPEALLDYSEILIQSSQYTDAVNILDQFKEKFPDNPRTNILLLRAYIGSNTQDKTDELLKTLNPDMPEVILAKYEMLNKEIRGLVYTPNSSATDTQTEEELKYAKQQADKLHKERVALLEKLLTISPERAPVPINPLRYCYNEGRKDEAIDLLDEYLKYLKPVDNKYSQTHIQILTLRAQADEPDPQNIPQERSTQIVETALLQLPDKQQSMLLLGSLYDGVQEYQKAFDYYKKAYELQQDDNDALSQYFEAALKIEDIQTASNLVEKAKSNNADGCEGLLFASRIDMANENYDSAIIKLNECITVKPLSPITYVLRSQCNTSLEKFQDGVDDAKKALDMSFLDGQIAKLYASAVSSRNQALQPNVTLTQKQELEKALSNAIVLNPADWKLRGMYAELVAESQPETALAIRQSLSKNFPNFQTYLMLGNMAMKMATQDISVDKARVLYSIAGDAYSKAYEYDPANEGLLQVYSEYYRLTGQPEKAEALFASNESLVWQFHLRDGQNEKAKEVLLDQYSKDPKNSQTLVGLITVSNRMGDNDSIIRYSKELINGESNADNVLFVAQTLLDRGLLAEAEQYLSLLKEKYPEESRRSLLEAWILLSKGQQQNALNTIDDYLAKEPDSAKGWQIRGQINRLMGNLEDAVRNLQKSSQLSPQADTTLELARAYTQKGDELAAIGVLKDALAQGQAITQARLMLEELYKQEKRETELEKLYSEAIQKYPNNPSWYLKYGQYCLSKKEYPKAESLFSNAWKLTENTENNSSAFSLYLSCLVDSGKYDDANKLASAHIEGNLSAIAYTYLGLIQIKLGDNQKGINYYRTALDKAGDEDAMITNILTHMLNNVGRDAVENWCTETLEGNPDSIPANTAMFRLYQKDDDIAEAAKYINKCMEIVGEDSDQWQNYAIAKALMYTAGYIKTSDKKYLDQSISIYEKILSLPNNFNNGDILNNLAYLLADNNKQIEDAVNYAERALNLAPNDPSRMDTYAYALLKSGNYEKALELLQSAIVLYERNNVKVIWDIYYHLGLSQEGLDNKKAAVDSFKRALEIGGDDIPPLNKQQIQTLIETLSNN